MNMKNLKRMLCWILAVTMVLGLLPSTVLANGSSSFKDVKDGDWFKEAVEYVTAEGLMVGVGGNKFDPNGQITRAMVVTVLYRMEGEPETIGTGFSDTGKHRWYSKAVIWAKENGIVHGYGDNTFRPDVTMTREEMVAVFYRYSQYKGYNTTATKSLDVYSDRRSVQNYAVGAMEWAVSVGLITGFPDGTIRPQGQSTRAQLATVLMRFYERALLIISITNDDYCEERNSIITQDETYVLTGTVTNGAVSKVDAVFCGYDQVIGVGKVVGTENWSTDVPLKIGTNKIKITAFDNAGHSAEKEVIINRINAEVTYNEKVKIADAEDYYRLNEDFIACWVDDSGTIDEKDDNIIILAKDDALLLSQIENGLLSKGEVYMIPQNEIFVTGFTAVYEHHRAPSGNAEYSLDTYPDEGYEEIVFSYPNFADLFSNDVSLDFSNGINSEDPIAFAMLPDGTKINVQEEYRNDRNPQRSEMIGNPLYPKAGWQPQELAKNAFPSFKYNVDQYNRMNITLNWNDIVIYDHDGIKNEGSVDYGQVKLSGEVGITNLKYSGGVEWHPNFIPWELDLLPQQILSKLEYNFGGSLTVKGDASVSTSNLIEALNDGFDNKSEFWGMSVSGVSSLKNKWVLGVVGLNLIPPNATFGTTIKGQAAKSTLTPSLILVLFIDIDGNVTVEGAMTFGYETKVEKGFNIQKNGYTGSYGSQNQNRSDKHYNIGFDRALDVYDKNEGNFTLKFGGKVEASLDFGIGVGGGLMIGGVCPAMVDGEIFYRANGLVEGEIQILPELNIDGYASLYHGIGAQTDLAAKLFIDTKIGDAGFDVNKHYEHMFWEQTKSTSCLEGTVYVADNDGNNNNNAIIPDAYVKVTKNDTGKVWSTTTDSSGKFRFTSLPDGEYTLEVEKSGYDPYKNNRLIFSKQLVQDVFLNQQAVVDGICSLSGKITIADDDTNMTNNKPLDSASVLVVREDNLYSAMTTTDVNGMYKIDNLPSGVYDITISKVGFITIKAEIAIADNIHNYYNAMIEAVSEDYEGTGSISGTIYDAVTGYSVPYMTLLVRNGVNVMEGDIVAKTKTDMYGSYLFADLPAGNYTIEIVDERNLENEKDRYFSSMFIAKVLGGKLISNQNGHVTNGIAAEQLRIVLRWGEYPYDLDSHIVGPTSAGETFHVYFANDSHYESARMVDLDLDDITSYGPETTTIYRPVGGEYVFMVHDYTNKEKVNSDALANSGAYVEIYLGTSNVAAYTFYVPSTEGTLWTVFSYNSENGMITPINSMSYESDESSVGLEYRDEANTTNINDEIGYSKKRDSK